MGKQRVKEKRRAKGVSRRDFIKTGAAAGTVTAAGLAGVTAAAGQQRTMRADFPFGDPDFTTRAREGSRAVPKVNRREILFALGDTLIPSAPGDPGYKDLEWYGITEEVNRRLDELPDDDLGLFNTSSVAGFKKKFTELSEGQRADYFNLILQTGGFKDEALQKRLREVYDQSREAVFTVYYQNFPESHWPRDANRVPLLRPGDEHQITNPSTPEIVTGWDVAGYAGPLTWEEEERRRNFFKKIRWQE
ncbi:MAG: twin-arginine translocation signal domain-containing protein [Pyrinomonadaceae bacterium]